MKYLLILNLLFTSTLVLAGNESGGGPGMVDPDFESNESVLWGGFEGDMAQIKTSTLTKEGWVIESHLISNTDLQKVDTNIGNAVNLSAKTNSWVQVK